MKKIITMLCLIALITGVNAQETIPNSFWGIKFGLSFDEVKTAMLKKPGVTYAEDSERIFDDILLFNSPEFAGKDCGGIYCDFVDNKFYCGAAFLLPSSESGIFDLYNDVKENLIKKYGDPSEHVEIFKTPYYEGDGYETQAIKNEKATFESFWRNGKNTISLEITKDVEVMICYIDIYLGKVAAEKEDAKNSNDL